jgi:Ca2+-dependent lipid-binding protein
MHQKEKTKQGTRNSNTKNHLNSSHGKKTEDMHSLYGKKEIENESEKPENKVVFKTSKTSTCRSRWNGLLQQLKKKPSACCCQGLEQNPLSVLSFFSSFLTVTPECKQETPSIYCVFFYSASLAFFFSVFGYFFLCFFLSVFLLFFCSLFFFATVRSLEGLIYSLNMSLFRKDSMH